MVISDNKKLRDVQLEFREKFPYLKLEFYAKHHQTHEGSPEKLLLDPGKTIGEVRTKHTEGELSIDSHQKVSTLENKFHEMFGLNAQVFRKSGGLWLQTTSTDDWTLADQNKRGEVQVKREK